MDLKIKKIIIKKDNFSPEQLDIIDNSIKEISKYPLPNKDICSKKIHVRINRDSEIEYTILYEVADDQYKKTTKPFPADYYVQNGSGIEKIVKENFGKSSSH